MIRSHEGVGKVKRMKLHPPLIAKGSVRTVLFLICYVLLIIATGAVLAYVAPAGVGALPTYVLPVLLNFMVSLLLVFAATTLFDRKPFTVNGWQWKGYGNERLVGVLAATTVAGSVASILWAMRLAQWFPAAADWPSHLGALLLLVAVAVGEELVFRGYLLRNLMDSFSKEAALFASAIVFALFHSLNPDFSLTAFLNIFIAGVLLGVNFIFTRNLWFGIFLHLAWNWLQGPLLGFAVSGLDLPSMLELNSTASVILSGGRFGLEGSWLTLLLLSGVTAILYVSFRRRYQ